MLFLVFLVHLSDFGVRVILSGHSSFEVCELLQDLLSHIVLVVVFDHFKVELSPGDFDLGSEFLSEKLPPDGFSETSSSRF